MQDIGRFLQTTVLITCLVAWITAFRYWARGESPITCESRQHAPWDLLDILLTLVCLFATVSLAAIALSVVFGLSDLAQIDKLPTKQKFIWLFAESVAQLATLGLSVSILILRHRATLLDIGWATDKLWSDTKTGFVAFLMLAPIVYSLQFFLTQWFESKHPLIQLLPNQPAIGLAVVAVFTAVIVAPLTEEYLFRVLLQGWLEKTAQRLWHKPLPPQEIMTDTSELADVEAKLDSDMLPPGPVPHDDFRAAYAPPAVGSDFDNQAEAKATPRQSTKPAVWPIFVSSLIFALMHYQHGPDWVPLFFFAVGLGYLYRQTHRIWPCIMVHFLLNAVSMTLVLIQAFQE